MKPNVKLRWEAPASAMERWNPRVVARADDNALNIYSTIGDYGDGTGTTAKLVSSILRKQDGEDVVVNINSPGGDFFEGLAIHSLLKEYEGKVSVRVLGMAASAASVVALAGDEIEIADSGFFMIHNAWTVALGNRHDMKEAASMLEKFDDSMARLYAKASDVEEEEIRAMMDREEWIDAQAAVAMGFAGAIMGAEEFTEEEEEPQARSLRILDVTLAKAGMPRSERRSLLKEITGTPRAANPTPSAGLELSKALEALLAKLNQK